MYWIPNPSTYVTSTITSCDYLTISNTGSIYFHTHIILFNKDNIIAAPLRSQYEAPPDEIIGIIQNMTTDFEPPFNLPFGTDTFDDVQK